MFDRLFMIPKRENERLAPCLESQDGFSDLNVIGSDTPWGERERESFRG